MVAEGEPVIAVKCVRPGGMGDDVRREAIS
jgi:hypothetical protein